MVENIKVLLFTMDQMFPIPRITEPFVDFVADKMGWNRYEAVTELIQGRRNADYLSNDLVIELKIFEEEGLAKDIRQGKVAELYNECFDSKEIIDISFEDAPEKIGKRLKSIISKPIQGAIKTASKQIKETKEDLNMDADGVLIAVNNGYTYLNADNFEKIVLERCRNDSSNIEYAVCVTIEYHQGGFDAFVLCHVKCYSVNNDIPWKYEETFRDVFQDRFGYMMSIMMADQMNPEFWENKLTPVSSISFEREGVTYIREALHVPDSRFESMTK